jgi:hypothetical protein
LTWLSIPKITDEPLGAPQIFETLIQAKHSHSFPGPNPQIQVKIIRYKLPEPIYIKNTVFFQTINCERSQGKPIK